VVSAVIIEVVVEFVLVEDMVAVGLVAELDIVLDIVLNKLLAGFPFAYIELGLSHIDHMTEQYFDHRLFRMMNTVYFVERLHRRHLVELHLGHSL